LIQQALLQVLQPLTGSDLQRAQLRLPAGAASARCRAGGAGVRAIWTDSVVVDVDLEKFFDRVNHDILIDRLQETHRRCRHHPADSSLPEQRAS
jgi:RNA-directed DNA polymerase